MKRAFGWALVVTAALCTLGVVGCSDGDKVPVAEDESGGQVGLDLMLPSGAIINTVKYTITGPGGFKKTGTIDVSQASKISGLIGGIPAGNGYTIVLTAKSLDGGTACAGSATFNVKARVTTNVTVAIACREAPRTGSVLINGELNTCPTIDGVSALPAQVFVTASTQLDVAAHDSDGGPHALTYEWKATSGSFSSTTTKNPLFTCDTPGTATIAVAVGDGDCRDVAKIQVECSIPDSCDEGFDAYMSALGEMTADCIGRIDPRDFRINREGNLEPAFAECVNKGQSITPIRQLLSLQLLSNRTEAPMLPLARACIAGRFAQALRDFEASGVTECPSWTLDHAVNPITPEVIDRVTKLLPQPLADGTITGPLNETVLPLLKVNHVYNVELATPANQACKNPSDCARVCGEMFPSFIIGPESDTQVLTDTSSWLDTTLFDAVNTDSYLRAGFYHPMGFTSPSPMGVQFGAYNRFFGCAPGTSCAPSTAPVGVTTGPEACNYFTGFISGRPVYKQTKLQTYCTDPMNVDTCTSYCGVPLK